MRISLRELRFTLDIAADISRRHDAYVRDDALPKKDRDDVQAVVQERLGGSPIEIYELNDRLEHETIVGYYVAEDVGYSVLVSAGLDEDDLRFVVCKELLHILIDVHNKEYRSTDMCGHLDEMALSFLATTEEPKPSVRAEWLAEICAMELLFPYTDRKKELEAGNVDFKAVAEKYGVPQYHVERYLQQRTMEEIGAMMIGGS